MHYILDDSGYIEEISSHLIECNEKTCTPYTGAIPEGYDSLDDWLLNANIQAYKLDDDGNLIFDEARDNFLKLQWELEEERAKMKKIPIELETDGVSSYECYYIPAIEMVFCSFYVTGKTFATGTRHIIATIPEGYRPNRRTALAMDGLQDSASATKASVSTAGEIGFTTSAAKESGDDLYIAGCWTITEEEGA